jgi:hypothetical protein
LLARDALREGHGGVRRARDFMRGPLEPRT